MNKNFTICQACEEDVSFILSENEKNVEVLSKMDPERFNKLKDLSSQIYVVKNLGENVAFLMAFREGTPEYDSENYQWFSKKYPKFLYIDRVVVTQKYRGQGIGKLLYQFLFDYARNEKIPVITAEIDLIPYNGESLAFHKKMGFEEVGIQWVRQSSAKVSLQCAYVE